MQIDYKMTEKQSDILLEKIIKAVRKAIAKVYEDARKNGDELVISENGKVKRIKVT